MPMVALCATRATPTTIAGSVTLPNGCAGTIATFVNCCGPPAAVTGTVLPTRVQALMWRPGVLPSVCTYTSNHTLAPNAVPAPVQKSTCVHVSGVPTCRSNSTVASALVT